MTNKDLERSILDIPEIKLESKTTEENSLRKFKKKKVISFIALVLLLILIVVGLPILDVYKNVQKVVFSAKTLEQSAKSQDLSDLKKEIQNFKTSLVNLQDSYMRLSWTKVIPGVGSYWRDGNSVIKASIYGTDAGQLMIQTLEPYADIIGFGPDTGQKAKSGQETANDRVTFVIETINEIIPKVGEISEKVNLVKSQLDTINPNRYPEKIGNFKLRDAIKNGISQVDQGAELITQGKPLMEEAPYLLGMDSPRTYLVLFQNDKELRPTGGFLTAYSIMKVNRGKVQPVSSNDIYNLDAKYKPEIPAPEAIIKYLKGPYLLSKNLRLRDMNFSPDFRESMDMFSKESAKVGIKNIDGIIAVDTQLLVKLLSVIGEIGVPGFGNFSTKNITECNCPQVIYELESYADIEGPIVWDPNTGKIIYTPPNYYNRKAIVGPLMNSILSNALGQPKEKIPDLFNAGFESLIQKHVLFYLFDKKAQDAVEAFNIAGRIKDYQGDFLHINDANLGGRKSNLYVTQEVQQEVKAGKDGNYEKTLTITYKNSQDYDGWLNSVLPNWTRIYVPAGSELIEANGFEEKGEVYTELGKTVFSGGFKLRPKGVVRITIRYKLPFKAGGEYKLLVQKQPGVDTVLYTITIGKQLEEVFLKEDKEFRFRI